MRTGLLIDMDGVIYRGNELMRSARKELGLATSQTVMLGDTMETDILGGVQMGYRTVLTLTGGTSRSDLAKYAYSPDLIVESVAELCEPLRFLDQHLPKGNVDDDTVTDLEAWKLAHR